MKPLRFATVKLMLAMTLMELLVVVSLAEASEWVPTPVSFTVGGVKVAELIDAETLKSQGDIRDFWSKFVAPRPFTVGGVKYSGGTTHMLIDCLQRRSRLLGGFSYDESGAPTPQREEDWADIAPDTTNDHMRNFLCDKDAAPVVKLPDARTAHWLDTGDTVKEGNASIPLYIDKDTIKIKGDLRDFWLREGVGSIPFVVPGSDDFPVRDVLTNWQLSCSSRQKRIIAVMVHFADGTSDLSRMTTWTAVTPGSTGESMLSSLCGVNK